MSTVLYSLDKSQRLLISQSLRDRLKSLVAPNERDPSYSNGKLLEEIEGLAVLADWILPLKDAIAANEEVKNP